MEKKYTQKEVNEITNRALDAGKKMMDGHDRASPETIKMVGDLNTKIEVTYKAMEDLKETVVNGFAEIKESIKELSATKANKWTEKVLISAGASIGFGVLGVAGWALIEAIKRWQ